jgi:plasmid stabilization system protein ParE
VNVELSDEAREQVRKIDAWWRTNRPAAPDLFTNELALALTKLEGSSSLGTSYDAGSKTVRRMLLRRTHYYLYLEERADTLFVLAVWSAFRGVGPTL